MKKTVTKSEIVERMARKLSCSILEADNAYNALVDVLAENILEGKGTSFRGVGIVTAEHRPAKRAVVPKQSEPVTIPARIVCNFTVVRSFAEELRQDRDQTPTET